jgi:hypothetical protein
MTILFEVIVEAGERLWHGAYTIPWGRAVQITVAEEGHQVVGVRVA